MTDGLLALTLLFAISPYSGELRAYASSLADFGRRLGALTRPASAAQFAQVLGPAADALGCFSSSPAPCCAWGPALYEGYRYLELQGWAAAT